MKSKDSLTEPQQKVFDDAMDQAGKVLAAGRSRLLEAGVDLEQTVPCEACACPDFVPGGQRAMCGDTSCRHPVTRHRWF